MTRRGDVFETEGGNRRVVNPDWPEGDEPYCEPAEDEPVTPRVPTLEEMAQVIAERRREHETALARLAELTPAYDAARDKVRDIARSIRELERAMGGSKRAHAIERALAEAGIVFEGPRLVAVKAHDGHRWYALVAVGSAGTGLYLYTPDRSHRYEGKTHAVLRERAVAHGFDPEAPTPHYRDKSLRSQTEAGLVAWQERGTGDVGAHSGAYRPLAPPEGGRWRWLKVREQDELTAGVE